ncbi:dihydrofolate synthase/folylpolyglutamate synthase [Methylomarinovum caldicuralii]|uniref:Dihydrofolate synthase/folylpolyglutamate synthase n=1 Tax=Methylomarinovum caldicuralii TaxID=438856 RepID=A0AAU9C2L5_9GAMM|nr:bifunctional tetrahydrofolate synthase/dihydrofolate synthase [Methylomarinovum caldicuralii]BCX83005.1 dihydrofolate synthase/folylpolyglutamate synthase [Methylomarinovum caldicuralii]
MTGKTDTRRTLADWLAWQQSLHPRPIDLGLARVRQVFARLQPGYRPPLTLTVGGTNGKGSCIALLDAVLRAQGLRVGAYTSPHLLRYNERIRIDGREAGDGDICEAFARIEAVRDGVSLSFFEFATLAALDLFARAGVDVQLLEVGLGGRLDAVNLIDADAVLVTSIDIDHKEWLGEDRDSIGREKAGILRAGRPAVVGDRDPPRSLVLRARELGARLHCLGRDFDHRRQTDGWCWQGWDGELDGLPLPALPGRQQLDNAAAVIAVLRCLAPRLAVSTAALHQGLATVRLPGRYQLLPGTPERLLDVAHNPQAAALLAEHLRRNWPGRRVLALFTAMADKDIEGMLTRMGEVVDVWALAPLAGNPRAASSERLLTAFERAGLPRPLHGFSTVAAALDALESMAGAEDLIVVFGSFFLVAELLAGDGSAA